ncbi:MAG: large-conductance mechanosensitive channel protein MscL [Bacteroidia bacterium]|nr:large-conductance mechanosensitive channel protein MscL [Bacteroidia bacterium]
MGIIKEFKEFAMQGNVLDLAVGIIIGAEFGKIVNSLVNDVLMPPIGKLLGGVNFTDLNLSLDGNVYKTLEEAKAAGAPVIGYGSFVQSTINFIIVAFCIFILIKAVNKMNRKPAEK